ncbi:MAG: UDP-N-acetylenolpyruvoylglucosamine reductase [Blastocatellia bacterium]|nr:MAG: UDP-N-acetylenolpyruvoylglucosamine reductase [Blastocatellia bacterium]
MLARRGAGGAYRAGACLDGNRAAGVGLTDLEAVLRTTFGRDRVRSQVLLAPYTTFRVGGPADLFFEPRTSTEIVTALMLTHAAAVPVTMLGGGSNVLVSDTGVRGLVLRPRGGTISRIDDIRIESDAAVSINGLVRWTINHACGGLEAWAGTPGTVGGGIFGNAHFGGSLLGEVVSEVQVASRDGTVATLSKEQMAFAYDRSRLQGTGEVLLSAKFMVSRADPAALRARARESLAFRKRTQPLDTRNAGCIFQNPDPARDRVPDGIPAAAGALIDRAGLKGHAIGGASVSKAHGNFIVNEGDATAEDIRRLIRRCREEVRRRFAVDLLEEIVYLGEFE